jgi:hypothetical protein
VVRSNFFCYKNIPALHGGLKFLFPKVDDEVSFNLSFKNLLQV